MPSKLKFIPHAIAIGILMPSVVSAEDAANAMTIGSKCEILKQAVESGDQNGINEGARWLYMANLAQADIIKAEFKESDAQRLFQRGFDICLSEPEKTIEVAGREAFAEVYSAIKNTK